MITYNRQSLDHLDQQQQARDAFEKKLITQEEYDRIRAARPYQFYLPDPFIRIGLFLLTVVAAACGLGLFLLGALGGGEMSMSIVTILFGVICIFVLEVFIHQRKMYGAGVDDALLWIGATLIFVGVEFYPNAGMSHTVESGFVLLLALLGILRYLDHGMALVAYGAFLCLIFYSVGSLGPVARSLLPFLVIGLSIAGYALFTRFAARPKLRHYHSCLGILRLATLISCYGAGNYYIVRELNAVISGQPGPIALGWLWWTLTLAIPIFYIVRGIKNKNTLFLWTGLALVAATIFTIRNYYHLAPVELELILGGVILLAGVYGLTRYLRTPKYGFTAEAPDHPHTLERLPVEGIILAESFSNVASQPADPGVRFGGGTTGGGGAGGQF